MSKTITVQILNDNGSGTLYELPARFEVCRRCEGYGTHLTPSIGNHAYSQEEFFEAFSEPEDREEYFSRGGIYDVTCEECRGARVVPVVDVSNLSNDEKVILSAHLKQQQEEWEADADSRAEARMERMMCGEY